MVRLTPINPAYSNSDLFRARRPITFTYLPTPINVQIQQTQAKIVEQDVNAQLTAINARQALQKSLTLGAVYRKPNPGVTVKTLGTEVDSTTSQDARNYLRAKSRNQRY